MRSVDDRSLRVGLLLAVVVGLEAVVILTAGGFWRRVIPWGDGPGYQRLAENWVDHGRFSIESRPPYGPTVFRAPGYPAFLAMTFVAGRSPLPVRVAQFALLWLTSWLLYRLGSKPLGHVAALAGALLCATYLQLAVVSCYHTTEMLATFLCVALVARASSGAERPLAALGLGLIAGAAALVRPSLAPLGAAAAAVPLLGAGDAPPRRKATLALLVCAGFACCVLPWVARNYALAGRFIPLAVGRGYSRYVSAKQYAGEISYKFTKPEWDAYIAGNDRRNDEARAAVSSGSETQTDPATPPTVRVDILVERSYEEDGGRTFRRLSVSKILRGLPTRVYYLWATGDLSPWQTGPFHTALQALHVALAACVVAGVLTARLAPRDLGLLLMVPVYITAFHLVYHVETRYSFPARPFLLLFAGAAVVSLSRRTASWFPPPGPPMAAESRLSGDDPEGLPAGRSVATLRRIAPGFGRATGN